MPDIDAVGRQTLWERYVSLSAATTAVNAGSIDYAKLSTQELSGRMIKSTVRTAQALAITSGQPMDMALLEQVLQLNLGTSEIRFMRPTL